MSRKVAYDLFLSPIAVVWNVVHRMRRFAYRYGILKQHDFQVPIISIGNLAFGGAGKTPFTLWLANYLADRGKRPMILMRGYKGRLEHSSKLLKSGKMMLNPFEYGDEALLFSRRAKNASIVVGKRRSENLELYFDQELPDVVILDDGHQHLRLERNLNIVLFNALLPLERYRVAPLGYMREDFSALREADAIVITMADKVTEEEVTDLKSLIGQYVSDGTPFIHTCHKPVAVYGMDFKQRFSIEELIGVRVICVAGIATNSGFFSMVEGLGTQVVGKHSFPDHHRFKIEEISPILREAEEKEAYILTTEKDMVKIRHLYSSDDRILYLEINIEFISGEKEICDIISKVSNCHVDA